MTEISLFNEAIHLEQIKTTNPHEINEEFSVHSCFPRYHVGDVPTNNKAPTQKSPDWLWRRASSRNFTFSIFLRQRRIQGKGTPSPPLFLYQTDVRRAEKNLFLKPLPPPPPLSQGIDDRAPLLPYLKVWICHCPMPYLPYQANQVFVSHLLATRCKGLFARRDVSASATEIPYWWRKICPESGQELWLVY